MALRPRNQHQQTTTVLAHGDDSIWRPRVLASLDVPRIDEQPGHLCGAKVVTDAGVAYVIA
jgi:hypothetical protein